MTTRCEHCLNLEYYTGEPIDGREVLSEGRRHRRKFLAEFKGAAAEKRGCRYCKFIVDAISHVNPKAVGGEQDLFIWLELTATGGVWIERVSKEEDGLSLGVYTPLGHEPAWPGVMQSVELSCSPSEDQAYNFIRARLRDCDDNHPSCKSSLAELPTRMIDVGVPRLRGEADYVRLVETSSLPRAGGSIRYIALSYCWGIGQSVTTVSSNYKEFTTKGISVSSLPPTLWDAITVTRKMGQRYIWIDALCIIQDSSSDWELEAARMALVYQNAYLTISAGTAAAAAEGFLEERQHIAARDKNIYTTERDASGNPNYFPKRTLRAARVIPSSVNHWKYMVNHGLPLNTRGWTMQEKILSRRVITYSAHELQWTCLSLNICECGYLLDSSKRGHNTISIDNRILSRREAFYQWAKIITEYSGRCLTYAEDKLPAISGVDNLPKELAWKAMPPHPDDNNSSNSKEVPKQYIAPTFSWASIRGGSVECVYLSQQDQYKFTPCCTISSYHSNVMGQNPFGRISSGSITLHGHLIKGQLTIKQFHGFYTVESVTLPGDKKVHMFMDTFLEEFSVSPDGVTEWSVRRSPIHLSLPGPKTDRGIDCPVHLFLLGYWIRSEGDDDDDMEGKPEPEPDMAFLVLGRAPNQGGKWERSGFGRCQRQFEGANKLVGEGDRKGRLRGWFGEVREVTVV